MCVLGLIRSTYAGSGECAYTVVDQVLRYNCTVSDFHSASPLIVKLGSADNPFQRACKDINTGCLIKLEGSDRNGDRIRVKMRLLCVFL